MQKKDSNLQHQLLFNYCRIGSVFRAVILVQTVTAIGLLYVHDTFLNWLAHFAMSNSAIMPATLLWLLIGCICKDLAGMRFGGWRTDDPAFLQLREVSHAWAVAAEQVE